MFYDSEYKIKRMLLILSFAYKVTINKTNVWPAGSDHLLILRLPSFKVLSWLSSQSAREIDFVEASHRTNDRREGVVTDAVK